MLRPTRRPVLRRSATGRVLAGLAPAVALVTAAVLVAPAGSPGGTTRLATRPVAATPVAVSSPGFEDGATGWSGTNASITAASAHSGRYGVQLDNALLTTSDAMQTVGSLARNTRYRYSAWVRSAGSSQQTGQLFVSAYTFPSSTTLSSANTVPTTWTQRTIEFRTGASSTSARIGITRGSGGSAAVYYDDVTLVQLDDVPPAAPAVTATAGDGQVVVRWSPAATDTDLAAFQVFRGGALVSGATLDGGARSFTDTGLTNGTAYSYTVTAIDTSDNVSPSSASASATPVDMTPPAVPSGLRAETGDNTTTLRWTANTESDLASYRVLRDGQPVATVPAGTTTHTAGGLTNGRTYSWSLASVDQRGNTSAASPVVTATPQDTERPARVTDFRSEWTRDGSGETRLSWTRSASSDAAVYRIYRNGVLVAELPASATSHTDAAEVEVLQRYVLVVVDDDGLTSVDNPETAEVPRDWQAPGTLTGLTAAAGDRQVVLSWNSPPAGDGVTCVRYSQDGAENSTCVAAGTTTATVTGLTNGRSYRFTVAALDRMGNRSSDSAPVDVVPLDAVAPAVPVGLAAAAGENQVVITWTANTEPDLAGYDLYRNGARVPGAVLDASATSWTDTGLLGATSYSYKIRSRDSANNLSDFSAEVTATPTDTTPPAVPRGVSATAGDSVTTLQWTEGTERDLDAYEVLRDGAVVATLDRNAVSYRATGLVNGTLYSWTLVAVDRLGNASAPSSPVTSVPRDAVSPAVPSGLTATAGDGLVTLSWTRGAESDLATYQVLRDGALVATTTHPTTGYTDTGLVNGTAYAYSLKAVDTSGNTTAASAAVTATPRDLTAPAAPTGLTTNRGSGSVDVTWTAGAESDLASYTVYRDGTPVATVAHPTTAYRDATADQGTTYAYRVSATDRAGNESSPSSSSTVLDAVAPVAPGTPVATSADQAVALSWARSTSSDVHDYRVVRDGVEVATLPAGTLTWTDTGRTNGVTHTYVVRAYDAAGNAAPSAQVTGTAKDAIAPGAPTNVTAVPGSASATVSWTRPSDGDLAAYRVYSGAGTLLATVAHPATSAVISGLPNGTAVQLYVVAVDTSTNPSAASATVSVTPVAAVTTVPAGAGGTGAFAVSRDGRWLVTATAARLELADGNDATELYRIDTTGAVGPRRIKPVAGGFATEDPTNTSAVAISDDGTSVVLTSDEALVPADTNSALDVYRADLSGSTVAWTLVSVSSSGTPAAGRGAVLPSGADVSATSPSVAVSADGRRVAFYSARSDLVGGSGESVVVKDLGPGTVTRASTGANGGNLGGRTASGPALAMSADGRYVLFTAGGSGPRVVVRKDLGTTSGSPASDAGDAVVASSSAPQNGLQTEVEASRDGGDVAISDDGRYVVFSTTARLATNPAQSASYPTAFRKDLTDGSVVALGDGQTGQQEHRVAISADGARAAYTVGGDVRVRSVSGGTAGALVLVNGGSGGAGATSTLPSPVLLTGGRVAVVTQRALTSDDVNGLRDAYVVDIGSGSATALVRR